MLLCAAGTVSTVRAQKVTLNFRDAKLEQVFGRITEQTGYTFYYARPTVNPDKIVSIAVKDVDVRAALKQLLAADKVEIEIRDGKIYLSPPLLLQAAAREQSVEGVVRDAAGQPVVGAGYDKGCEFGSRRLVCLRRSGGRCRVAGFSAGVCGL